MAYSRQTPSPRYSALVEQYGQMQKNGQFTGIGCYKHQKELRKLINETGARTLLDYGCGIGNHLKPGNPQTLYAKLHVFCSSWTEALGLERITGYDPASDEYRIVPTGQFDAVCAIDVLEHIPAEDLPWVLEEIFSYALKFVFLTVAVAPAKKNLPNGENAHVTLRSQDWWFTLIDDVARKYPHIRHEIQLEEEVIKTRT